MYVNWYVVIAFTLSASAVCKFALYNPQVSLVNQTTPFNSVMGKGVDWFTRLPT